MTLANATPCGECLPCKAGKRCARILVLSPKDERALAKVRRVVGPNPSGRAISLRPAAQQIRERLDPPEPTVTVTCPKCGEPWEMLGYLAAALKLRGIGAPKCDGCRNVRPENDRADLR